jgi:YcxB-like protein
MEIEYTLESDDLIALAHTSAMQRDNKRDMGVLMTGVVFFLAGVAVYAHDILPVAIGFMIFFTFYCFWYYWHLGNVYRRTYSPESAVGLLGPQKLILTPEFLLHQGEGSETKYRWSRVSHAGFTAAHVFIYVNRIQAYVIPRRNLSEEQFQLLKEELGKRIEKKANS